MLTFPVLKWRYFRRRVYVRTSTFSTTLRNSYSLSFVMAQLNETAEFLQVESFISLLRKLSTKEFASERLPRHSLIRKQIESLIQSPADLRSLSTTLHKEMIPIISSLPSQKGRKHSFQVEQWPLFHAFRVREVPRIWKPAQQAVPDVDPILTQKATTGMYWPFCKRNMERASLAGLSRRR